VRRPGPAAVRWQIFGNGTRHLRASCTCGRFLGYLPQTPESLALVPAQEPKEDLFQ